MIGVDIKNFSNKRILLLQSPVGPFFYRFAKNLKSAGATVYKINFNGGDWLFYPYKAINFRYSIKEWPQFFGNTLTVFNIDTVIMFGDCRPIHFIAREIATRQGLEVLVFEEGYVRPDYITLERFGVNNYSLLPRSPNFYLNTRLTEIKPPKKVGHTFCYAALWAILYYLNSFLLWPYFKHYKHHRTLSLLEAFPWLRSFWRKAIYLLSEADMQHKFISTLAGKYFLVPLQVNNDSQIFHHSKYNSIEEFIYEVINSFATYAPKHTYLVIKHHPMDRGYLDYSKLLRDFTKTHNLDDRVYYIHDQHLPTLLKHARGVVLVNSTVGLSAIYYNTPIKVCGHAIYDMDGLTFTGTLEDFWQEAPNSTPDRKLFEHFYSYVVTHTQINGNFYKQITNNN